ncbi:polypeptide N-acetylgalactosaminyltransferase 13-like [Diadema antillarum]|uniref:polypeptide N-acetylgalactosaminyltransferase 13-like n=1 Tax=Diadema antillarum TaxID=105358 RepID=UPI003A8654EF
MRSAKGTSSRVILAVLYTSLLWFVLDVLILAMYSSFTDEGSGSTLKLPTSFDHQRNIREEDVHPQPVHTMAMPAKEDTFHALAKKRAYLNRTLSRVKEKRSRFSWGNELKENLLHSNRSGQDVLPRRGTGEIVEQKSVDVRGDVMKRQIEQLKKELDSVRSDKERLAFEVKKYAAEDRKPPQTFQDNANHNGESIVIMNQIDHDVHAPMVHEDKIIQKDRTPRVHPVRNLDVTSQPRDPHGPGEMGKLVKTGPEDESKVKIGWQHAFFNEYVSDMISLERSVPDVRPKGCKTMGYANDLPRTSVIICFTEESWSTLLRTVHSVINRSPPELIAEVLLVDDFSQRDYLKAPLDEYMKRFPKVRIIRLPKREGLIRARLIGADIARGPVLTFLDSHVECNVGWLEPLLQRIHDNSSNVVCPSIDSIDARTFQYTSSGQGLIGAFNWEMKFTWNPVPDYELRRRQDTTWPIRSPAMAGGLFSIDKAFFYKLGTYDPGFDIWGAENLELSFKTWMCGGTLEIIPCSRVAHIFRKQQPYKFPDGNINTFMRNTMRLVEVWVDQPYRDIFYSLKPQLMGKEFGDISDRVKLREDLHCHDFKWFLNNVFPALNVPNSKSHARGELRNLGLGVCLDTMGKGTMAVYPCHGEGNNQAFSLGWDNHLYHKNRCISLMRGQVQLTIRACKQSPNLRFQHTKGQTMMDLSTGKCLDVHPDGTRVILHHCDGSMKQKWQFSYYFNRSGTLLP